MPDPKLAEEIDRMRGRPDTATLYGYIYDNYDLLAERRARGATYENMRDAVAARGIRDANGNIPTVKAVTQSYRRVKVNKAQENKAPRVGRPPLAPAFPETEHKHSSRLKFE